MQINRINFLHSNTKQSAKQNNFNNENINTFYKANKYNTDFVSFGATYNDKLAKIFATIRSEIYLQYASTRGAVQEKFRQQLHKFDNALSAIQCHYNDCKLIRIPARNQKGEKVYKYYLINRCFNSDTDEYFCVATVSGKLKFFHVYEIAGKLSNGQINISPVKHKKSLDRLFEGYINGEIITNEKIAIRCN